MSRFLKAAYRPMKEYVPGLQPPKGRLLKLNTNESPYPPSPMVKRAIDAKLIDDLRLYNDLEARDLTDAIAEFHGVEPTQVVAGNGSDELLALSMLAFGESGATFADITYGFYPVWAELFGLSTRICPLKDDFAIDPGDYAGNDKMVIIANPNAPTGIALPLSGIRAIVQANPDRVVLVDEAYIDFGGESALNLLGQYDNLLIVRTFSKSRSLAGARVGYAIGPVELIKDLNKIRFSFHPYNVNSLSIAAGAAAMDDKSYFEACVRKIIEAREFAAAKLTELGFQALPSSTNFVFARHPGISGESYLNRLLEREILIRRFSTPRIEDFARISIGTMSQMEKFIEVTREILVEEGLL